MKKHGRVGVLSVLLILAGAGALSAGNCQVPSVYPTIQSAIDDESCVGIDVAAGTYTENLTIDHTVTINGDPTSPTVIDGSGSGLVIDAEEAGFIEPLCCAGTLTLNDLTVRGGFVVEESGAGIYVSGGTVSLNHCTISGNLNEDGSGGGLFMAGGDVTMNDCSVSGNTALNGGGVYVAGGTLTMNVSLLSGNVTQDFFGVGADASGGGIVNSGSVHLINCTVFGNQATAGPDTSGPARGGAILNSGTLEVDFSTIVQNLASPGGPSLQPSTSSGIAGPATLRSSILANNSGTNCGSSSSITDGGYNLSDDATCAFSAAGSSNGVGNLNLGSLADNGGPTPTIALLVPSPAIDRIPVGTNGCGTSIAYDQRGIVRPQDVRCDIGAFEVETSSLPCPKIEGFWKNNLDAWPVDSMTLGVMTYSEADLVALLQRPRRGDASLILADPLIVAKLNAATDAQVPQTALDAIAAADGLLAAHTTKAPLPYQISPKSMLGRQMVGAATTLDEYNNGLLTPGCAP